jgi:hypothetical protein
MSKPRYTEKLTTQTLEEGLEEYYKINPHITDPATQPKEFGEILRAHDVGHVIFGCDTTMRDELKILPMFWWTSECTFKEYLKMKDSPAVDVMYKDMIAAKGELQLILTIIRSLPLALIEIIPIWLKTRKRGKRLPFLNYDALLGKHLDEIRKEYDLLSII